MDLGGFAYLMDTIKHYTLTALESIWRGKKEAYLLGMRYKLPVTVRKGS